MEELFKSASSNSSTSQRFSTLVGYVENGSTFGSNVEEIRDVVRKTSPGTAETTSHEANDATVRQLLSSYLNIVNGIFVFFSSPDPFPAF